MYICTITWHKPEMNRSIKLVLWPRVLKLSGCPKRLDGVSWPVTEGMDLLLNPATVRSSVGLANHRTVLDMCHKSYHCKIFYKPTAEYNLHSFMLVAVEKPRIPSLLTFLLVWQRYCFLSLNFCVITAPMMKSNILMFLFLSTGSN